MSRLASGGSGDILQAVRPLPSYSSRRAFMGTWGALGVLTVGYAWFFGWLSLQNYWAYQMHALDMGNMGQAAWNTVHGHPFQFTNMRLAYNIEAWNTTTRLSFHVEALFPLISLVYFMYSGPESLLLLQTFALAAGGIAVFLLARDVLRNAWLALTFVVAYLLFPTLEGMNLYEFHPVSLATPLLLFAFLFAWRRQYLPFVICCLAAMGTKEEIGLVVALFGVYVALVNGARKLGLAMAIAGVFWPLFVTLVVEHHYRQPGALSYVQTRYGYLCGGPDARGKVHCHGLRGPLHTLVHDPAAPFRVLFTWPKLDYLARLLSPTGFIALLAPLALLLGAPTFLLNVFSQDFHMYSGLGDNSAELISVVMIASILGAQVLRRLLTNWMRDRTAQAALGAYILVTALWSQHVDGFTPLGPNFVAPTIGAHQHLTDSFVAMAPGDSPVSTQDQIDPHLSSRRYLYLFEDIGSPRYPPLPGACCVLLDVSSPTYPLPSAQLYSRAMDLLHSGAWGVKRAQDGLILLERGVTQRRIPTSFYSYAQADSISFPHRLQGSVGGLGLLGYDVQRVDLANHQIPNLTYQFYMRPSGRRRRDFQPILYETRGRTLLQCSTNALGLAWYPTSQWKAHHRYVVRMAPLETAPSSPGVAHLWASMIPVPAGTHPRSCTSYWSGHGRLWAIGSVQLTD